MSPLKIVVGASITVAASFAWGFLAHRYQVFPYALFKFAAPQAGIVEPDSTLAAQRRAQIRPTVAPLAVLKSLPYVQASLDPESDVRGVVIFDSVQAQPGVNFYNERGQSRAYLMDMQGDVIHEWTYRYPGPDGLHGNWHNAELLSDGSLLVVVENYALLKIDRCSELIWSHKARVHHGVTVDNRGDIYSMTWELVDAPDIHPSRKVLDDRITVFTADGILKDEMSVLDLLRDSPYEHLLPIISDRLFPDDAELDLFHMNHVEVFDGRLGHLSSIFEQDNLLVSIRHLNAIAIIDGRGRNIVWLWGPNNLAMQHHPQLLPNGHIVVFDNGTERPSRVIELDPVRRDLVWTYANETFFSSWGGSVQRLPNGNTLITETTSGYATEVTPDGEVTWRFANPNVDDDGQRGNIWRMTRFLPTDLSFLNAGSCNQLPD